MCFGHSSLTPPLFGGASPLLHPPHFIVGSLCIAILRDIGILCGHFPSIEGFGGVPPSLWEVWGAHKFFWLSMCSFLYFFVVYYVSRFDHSSKLLLLQLQWYLPDCHQCSVAPSLTWFPVSHGMVPPPPLILKGLWRCSWLCFCATATNSIFNASFGFCQLCYGFSTGRFLFQS